MIHGIVFGKFHPPHRGHKRLIDVAASRCDYLTVLVMASERETIPGALRASWLREMHPFTDIRLVPDEMPQSWTADRDDLFCEFAELVRAYHPEPIDRLFTSEWYGDLTAQALGCEHIPVDPMRAAVHVSSTMIRAEPARYLGELAPAVRAWCVPRIVVVGAESTGKTTLSQNLATRFGAPNVAEYGRAYTAWVGQTADVEFAWGPEDFAAIAREQQLCEDVAARGASPVLICDTDVFATRIWQRRYLGANAPQIADAQAGRRFYLHCLPDVPFVQDGTRDGEHVRADMAAWFREALRFADVPVTEIFGSWDERSASALDAVERACREPIPLLRGNGRPDEPNARS